MTLIQSLFLSFTQGVTEFLPISSSGHLNLFQHLFGLTSSLSFAVFLNTATFFSVIFFFKNQTRYFFDNLKYIIVGTIPAIFIGLFFKDQIESIFSGPTFLPYGFILTSILLFSTRFVRIKDEKLDYKIAILIGLMQALAILPAVSRSGATIATGLLLGLSPIIAFNFSFCLFIVASLGAIVLDYQSLFSLSLFSPISLLSFITGTLTGIIALYFLKKILQKNNFWYFGIYTLILAFSLLLLLR